MGLDRDAQLTTFASRLLFDRAQFRVTIMNTQERWCPLEIFD